MSNKLTKSNNNDKNKWLRNPKDFERNTIPGEVAVGAGMAIGTFIGGPIGGFIGGAVAAGVVVSMGNEKKK